MPRNRPARNRCPKKGEKDRFGRYFVGRWTDPMGRLILLDRANWRFHILKNHPEMALELPRIQESVEAPDLIGDSSQQTFAYHKEFSGRRLSVFCRRYGPERHDAFAFIATAYFVTPGRKFRVAR